MSAAVMSARPLVANISAYAAFSCAIVSLVLSALLAYLYVAVVTGLSTMYSLKPWRPNCLVKVTA